MEISVVINTYNAARYLAQALDSVADFDEVVVCDMESTDDTRAIAERYGCRVVTFPKGNHTIPEPARNFAIQSASCPYVLVIDADEVVPAALREYLYALTDGESCPDGLWLTRQNFFMGRFMHCYYPDYILRFFRREVADWPPTIHSMPSIDGRVEYLPRRRKDLALLHVVDETVPEQWVKMCRYTDNDAHRRRAKRYGAAALLYRPLVRFLKIYLLKGAIRDGRAGLIKALMEACYQFMIVSKVIDGRERGRW